MPDSSFPLPERNELKKIYEARRPAYDEALASLFREIRALLESQGYTPTIKFRVKLFENYFAKLGKIHHGERVGRSELISDLLGLRIICPFLEDLDRVESLITASFQVVETERKGAQNSFREFGYDSVHLLIQLPAAEINEPIPYTRRVCEIQLRTILQDAWAEVEHELVYKSDIAMPNESVKRKLASLNASLTLSDLIFQEIRDYQKEIRQRRLKRRESIEFSFDQDEPLPLEHGHPPSTPSPMKVEPLPPALASGLEKTMLEALKAHSQNEFTRAIELYGQLLQMELEPRIQAMVYNHRGMAYFSLGDTQQACDDFSLALQFDRRYVRCWLNRGLVQRILGKFEISIEDYTQAIRNGPANYEGYFGRAQSLCEIQLFSRALADCDKALDLQPDFAPARQLRELINRGAFSIRRKTPPPG